MRRDSLTIRTKKAPTFRRGRVENYYTLMLYHAFKWKKSPTISSRAVVRKFMWVWICT